MRGLRGRPGLDPQVAILSVATVVVVALLALLLGGSFFSLSNFQSMGYQIPEFGFLALAMTLAMLTGGIDLSVVANANLSGIVAAFVMTGRIFPTAPGGMETPRIVAACAAGLAVSMLCGLLNGFLVARIAVPPILATLGTMILFSGIAMAVTNGEGVVGFPQGFLSLGSGHALGIPIPLLFLALGILVVGFLLRSTIFGRKMYLLGENPTVALFSGINNKRVLTVVYLLCGLFAGCASLIMLSRFNSARVGYGESYLLQAILVVVLGGVNPDGGSGRLIGVVLGIIILQCLQNAFTLFAFTPYAKRLIWGAMLLIVMIISYVNANNPARRKLQTVPGSREGGGK
jgi:simple sugar transport system permease protein